MPEAISRSKRSDNSDLARLSENDKSLVGRTFGFHTTELVRQLGSSACRTASYSRRTGWRILGFGKHPEIAAAVQEKLRSLGFQATNFVLTNDEAGDARLVAELKRAEYDGVAIGGYINGQDAVNFPATEEITAWFNRVLNIVHANAPSSKIILVRGQEDVVPAIERVLGKYRPS
jgi:hypothetical protein